MTMQEVVCMLPSCGMACNLGRSEVTGSRTAQCFVLAAPCPNDTTGLIPLGCSVELTNHQETLLFVHQYSPLEECSWYVNNQFIGDTRYPLHREYALANGHTAVVSNFAQGQSDLRLSIQGKNSSLEGMEVKCSCQPRGGDPGPSMETQTVIGESGVTAVVSS